MNIIHQKDNVEPFNLLNIPITELAKPCDDPVILLASLSLAYQLGYKLATEKCHRFYHTMFAGQDETAIKN